MNDAYLLPLPENTTLCVYDGDKLIFADCGKWLMPLFALEDFLKTYGAAHAVLCAHDTAVGKAAAVLLVRMGIKKIHANIASALAERYIAESNALCKGDDAIVFSCAHEVARLLCATEDLLEMEHNSDVMYTMLRQRAKLVQGVEVRLENVHAKYGYIKNLSFFVPAGGRLMIAGENGAGKTTLLKLLLGIYEPLSGNILVDGMQPKRLPKRVIGYIPQMIDDVAFSLSVEEVVSLGIACGKKKQRELVQKTLVRTGAAHLAGRNFSSLSGGEKQKVSLARCLAQQAKLLLLDEPTAALDADNRKMVVELLRSLSVSEIPTIIVVTHDDELLKLSSWQKLVLKSDEPDAGALHG
ncbi:MAG: DUF1893 domain-containing protein [Treponema sp.]|nr:DUF1893 domain-containing protein [Treponema sp.]